MSHFIHIWVTNKKVSLFWYQVFDKSFFKLDLRLTIVLEINKILTRNKWVSFCPKTNLLWVKRILTEIRVKVERSEFDRNCESMADYELIKKWESNALNYSSVSEFGQNCCSLLSKE
jgi:hypothetical protein